VLESAESGLFPNLARELAQTFNAPHTLSAPPLPKEFLPTLLEEISRDLVPYASVAGDLESLIQLTRELRLTPKRPLTQDLAWYARLIARKIDQLPASSGEADPTRKTVSEAIRLGKMLEIALDQEPSLLQELGIQFQLSLAETLEKVLQRAAWSRRVQMVQFAGRLLPNVEENLRKELEKRLYSEESGDMKSRIEDVQLLIRTLRMASERAQGTMHMQATATQGRGMVYRLKGNAPQSHE